MTTHQASGGPYATADGDHFPGVFPAHPAQLTQLIHRLQAGDADASEALFAAAYNDLRRLARARLRTSGRHTLLDTGSLVHESYLRFAHARHLNFDDRAHFMGWVGRVMRSVIVDLARRRNAERRGGGAARVALDIDPPDTAAGAEEILRVHEALQHISTIDERMARVVEMRYFCGLTETEIATTLGVTTRTVRRDWEKARLLLREALI